MQCKSIKWKYRGLLAGACFATLLVAGAAGSAYGADYTPVTDARLANPEPENWLMTRGNYKGWSYSALDQINAYNVKNLVPVWSLSTGVDSGHESPPSLTTVSCSSRRRTARS
jgi:alcohol dehydrogenase (cytochrome c)